jgi:hypothetical protein
MWFIRASETVGRLQVLCFFRIHSLFYIFNNVALLWFLSLFPLVNILLYRIKTWEGDLCFDELGENLRLHPVSCIGVIEVILCCKSRLKLLFKPVMASRGKQGAKGQDGVRQTYSLLMKKRRRKIPDLALRWGSASLLNCFFRNRKPEKAVLETSSTSSTEFSAANGDKNIIYVRIDDENDDYDGDHFSG